MRSIKILPLCAAFIALALCSCASPQEAEKADFDLCENVRREKELLRSLTVDELSQKSELIALAEVTAASRVQSVEFLPPDGAEGENWECKLICFELEAVSPVSGAEKGDIISLPLVTVYTSPEGEETESSYYLPWYKYPEYKVGDRLVIFGLNEPSLSVLDDELTFFVGDANGEAYCCTPLMQYVFGTVKKTDE